MAAILVWRSSLPECRIECFLNVGGRQRCSHQACGEARSFGPLSDTDIRIPLNCVNGLNHRIELV